MSRARRRGRRGLAGASLLAAGLTLGATSPSGAATCAVPSAGHPTVAAALADPTCDPIQLAAGSHAASATIDRSLALVGAGSASTTVDGWFEVIGSGTVVTLDSLRLDASAAATPSCHASGLEVTNGARADGFDLVVVGRPIPIAACAFLVDGFESEGTARWSRRVP